ncbi:MAG TPA: ornithine carbamoyltransferase [Dehalococcoidia bacterium]|nr:ornithine carbamoyltransferase [Dehalococcoidia bacterium]
MKHRDLLSIADLSAEEVWQLIKGAMALKRAPGSDLLSGKVLALLFEKPSLRTRVSFEVAMRQLGGHTIYLSPQEVGLGKREPVADVARVLSRYVDIIAVRTFAHSDLQLLAQNASVPVINALDDYEHPCQALADLLTIYEKKGKLEGLTLAYVGDGNNVARSLFLAAMHAGMTFQMAAPQGYGLDEATVATGHRLAQGGARLLRLTSPEAAASGADILYTDVWTSMGQEAEAESRRRAFAGYQVDARLLSLAKTDAILMHPMPAHYGEELAPGMEASPQSVLFDQAENRLHMQKAILAQILG